MMTTATTAIKTMTTTTVNKDSNEDINGEDNDDLIFGHNNQPVAGCILGREGGDFDDDDNVNTMAGERVYSDEDNKKDPNGKDNITQTSY